jgi:putative ABC transport system permease protein
MRLVLFLDSLLEDARYAVRSLRRAPLFTFTAIVILALGTGVASGLFGIVHHLLVVPFDVPGHERLVMVGDRVVAHGELRSSTSAARFQAYRAASSLERLGAYAYDDAVLETGDGSEGLTAVRTTAELFHTLGVPMRAGRELLAEDARPGAAATALVSERFVRAHFIGVAQNAIGRSIRLDGVRTTIVGVVPAAHELPLGVDLWRPLVLDPAALDRTGRTLVAVGRLRPGASLAVARKQLEAIGREESRRFPDTDRELTPRVQSLGEGILDEISPMFDKIACVAMALTLLVVAANLAGLQLARGAARRREWAVRAALGASPARLARQSLVESLVLSLAGGLGGLWVAQLTLQSVLASIPPTVTKFIPGWSGIAVDGVLVAYALAVTVCTGLAFGLMPAVHAGRAPAAAALRGGMHSLGSEHTRARATLVIGEVALSLALLVGGALMVEGFRRMSGPDLGFDPSGVLTAQLQLREAGYPDAAARKAYHARALETLAALPGVGDANVAMISRLPSSGSTSGLSVAPEGGVTPAEPAVRAALRIVTPHTFDVLRLPMVSGRAVDARDADDAPAVVVVNQTLARRAWPGRDPLGRRLGFAGAAGAPRTYTVIGVARDVKRNWFERDVAPMAYVADAQWGAAFMQLIVRGGEEPLALAPSVRRALAAIDPGVPVDHVMSLASYLGESSSGVRVGATLMSWLGLFALALAAIGLYALVAFHVARRAPEFGVRMALGARREDILALVLGEGGRLVGLGLAVGVPLAAGLCWVMTATLFGVVRPTLPTLAGISAVLLFAAGIALWVPAWRASRLDPVEALRRE